MSDNLMSRRSLKEDIKKLLYISAAAIVRASGLSALRDLPNQSNSLRILTYHKVNDARNNPMSIPIAQFVRHQEYLKEHYRVVSLDELSRHLYQGEPLPLRAVLITFDDGYKDNFINAYPVLKRFGHRAVIFIPTDFVGHGHLPDDRDVMTENPTLGWDELKAMSDVFELASHGRTHQTLTRMPLSQAREEISSSKRILEEKLGLPVRAFSYPRGSIEDFNDQLEDAVKVSGYKFCFDMIPKTNGAGMNPFRLHRYHVENFGLGYFQGLLDGSADIVGFKDTRLGYKMKDFFNGIMGLKPK